MLAGGLHAGGNRVRCAKLRGWSYRLCTRATTTMIIQGLVGAGANSLMVSGFYFSLGFFTILCAFEGSRSFMGGSDVVHCVRVSLTGTTVAPS